MKQSQIVSIARRSGTSEKLPGDCDGSAIEGEVGEWERMKKKVGEKMDLEFLFGFPVETRSNGISRQYRLII